MNKYKIIGALDVFFGTLQIFYTLSLILFVLPKLNLLYSDFRAQLPSQVPTYLMLSIILCFGLANIFIGIKTFKELSNKDKVFKIALILLILNVTAIAILKAVTVFALIMPIYNLTSQL